MINRLSVLNIETLKKLPETGMGYQIVNTNNVNYVDKEIVVFNGQLAISINAIQYGNILKAIIGNDFVKAINAAKEIHLTIFDVIPRLKAIGSFVSENGKKESKSATDNQKENANGDELFVRLSAFKDDIRIDKEKGCLSPGSYTTTAADALRCKLENDDPIERYALPNELLIQWAFYIQPHKKDSLQKGNVAKAFGKRGNGREVYFEKGTSHRTFIAQTQWQHDYSTASK